MAGFVGKEPRIGECCKVAIKKETEQGGRCGEEGGTCGGCSAWGRSPPPTKHWKDLRTPGNQDTLDALKDDNRRPPVPRDPIPEDVLRSVQLDKEEFLHSLRTARRGAAGGPSGMRTEHLRPLLDNEEDSNKFFAVAQSFAQADIPEEILAVLRVGQMIALQKPNGGVRGIVVGDVVRRLVAKTMAKQFMTRFEAATSLSSTHWQPGQGPRASHTQSTPEPQCCQSMELELST